MFGHCTDRKVHFKGDALVWVIMLSVKKWLNCKMGETNSFPKALYLGRQGTKDSKGGW